MQRYINALANVQTGLPLVGAAVLVQLYPSGTTATIYAVDSTSTPVANPLSTDVNGQFSFYAANGRYQLTITPQGGTPYVVTDILLNDEILIVDTIAQLRALPVPSEPDTYFVRGSSALGDFGHGAGFFYWNATDTTADNGGTVLVCTANGSNAGRFNGFNLNSLAPNTITGATYTVGIYDTQLVANPSGTLTLTLPSPSLYIGRRLTVKNISSYAVVSASANVIPLVGGSATTTILPISGVANTGIGTWAEMISDGTNWQIVRGSASPIGYKTVASVTVTGNATLTAANMMTGNILRSGPTSAYTDTTDTAANIVASIPNPVIGSGYELNIANTVAFACTLAAGGGVTLAGTTAIAASASRKYVVTVTNVVTPAVTITGISSGTL